MNMERETRVSVFESENPAEIQLIKSKLAAGTIESFLNDKYMSFTTTPTAKTIRLMVNLQDEQKAFEIIDAYLKQTDLDLSINLKN
ncbi:DUF2007 domain-containing protein [Kaistella montana]|nr:DUF2007 domain-containing protein [Kaistella montana]MCQ4034887.1 DUF2007 domain-containing protein [Kaistella montana]